MIKFYVQFYDCYLLNKLKKFGAEKIVIDGNLVSFSIKKKHEKYLRRILNNYEYTWDENLNFQKTYNFIKKRIYLVAVFVVFLVGLFVADSFIYEIKGDENVVGYLQKKGISRYARKSSIDTKSLSIEIMEDFDDIAHCFIEIKGNTLVINIYEVIKPDKKNEWYY